MALNHKLKDKLSESLSSVLPIAVIVLLVSLFLVPIRIGQVVLFLFGTALLVLGMGLFQLGAETAMTPLGSGIGVEMSKSKKLLPALAGALVTGFVITIAEPDLAVLAEQVPAIPNGPMVAVVGVGVGLFLTVAVLRIVKRISLVKLLIGLYVLLIAASFLIPQDFIPVAFDSGGVTTGPITVPFIMALGAGLASIRKDRDAVDDSFGLVALCSVGPIIAVMVLGCCYRPDSAIYTRPLSPEVETTRDVLRVFVENAPMYFKDVFFSIAPIAGVFLIFQLLRGRFAKLEIIRIVFGLAYTYLGLVLFLLGANVGFAPLGAQLGHSLGGMRAKWLLIPIGMLIGFYIVKAEPAIQVLNRQIYTVTEGAISEKAMGRCLSTGVCVSVGLSMLRVLTGLPLQWILIPGYILSLVLACFVPKIFVGIAFDSGGVASGPMTSTFLLPLCLGACEVLGGNVMTDAFGVVAMVALTPLISVMIMGILYSVKKGNAALPAPQYDDGDDIVDLEEEQIP